MAFRMLSYGVALAGVLAMPSPLHADSPLPARRTQKAFSPDKHFYAEMHARLKTTVIYELPPSGEPQKRWSMPGWFRVAHLSNDGSHFVTAYDGANLLALEDRKPETIMLSFYDRGRLVRHVTLGELVPDLTHLKRTESHFAWGHVDGFNAKGFYTVETVDSKTIVFDATTGKRVSAAPEGTR